jgi:hypothetical protein
MSNLWVFGDSFTKHSQSNQEDFWTFKLAKMLGVQTYHNWSQYGVSNEYICDGFIEHSDNIQQDDYLIFIITWKSRHWFFEDRPEVSNFNMMSNGVIYKEYGKQSENAVKTFEKYLDSERLANIKLNWYYGYLNFVETHFPNTLIIPGFDNDFHRAFNFQVDGNLYPIGANEFETPKIGKEIFEKKWGSLDRRVGHMANTNHEILADKVYQTFTNKIPLDLHNGFKKEFINLSNYQDYYTLDDADIQTL